MPSLNVSSAATTSALPIIELVPGLSITKPDLSPPEDVRICQSAPSYTCSGSRGAVVPIPTLPSDVNLTTSASAVAPVFSKEKAKSAAALLLAFLIEVILAPYLLLVLVVDVFKNIEAP